jgi:hypothetical protein
MKRDTIFAGTREDRGGSHSVSGPLTARRTVLLTLALSLASCLLKPPPPVEEDRSIQFPKFHALDTTKVDAEKQPYEIDGVLLKAIDIAANDFLPPDLQGQQCAWSKEAYRYRAIRQGSIIFVQIVEDLDHCGRKYPSLDSGAAYAISTDGRILRRLFGSQLGELLGAEPLGQSIPVPDSEVGGAQLPFDEPSPYLPHSWQDAGPHSMPSTPSSDTHDGGSLPLDGSTPVPDGGLPGGARDGGM